MFFIVYKISTHFNLGQGSHFIKICKPTFGHLPILKHVIIVIRLGEKCTSRCEGCMVIEQCSPFGCGKHEKKAKEKWIIGRERCVEEMRMSQPCWVLSITLLKNASTAFNFGQQLLSSRTKLENKVYQLVQRCLDFWCSWLDWHPSFS